MQIVLIGCGCGEQSLTAEAAEVIRQSDVLVGSRRLLDLFGGENTASKLCGRKRLPLH